MTTKIQENLQIEIIDYYRGPLLLTVGTYTKGEEMTYEVNRADFEAFVDRQDKREFCIDSSDHRGEHVQQVGQQSWDEYYSYDIGDDLVEYLVVKQNDFSNIFKGVGKIVKEVSYATV